MNGAVWEAVLGRVLLGVMAGTLGACWDPSYYSSEAFFANTTHDPVAVRVFDLEARLRCDAVAGRSGEMLGAEVFGEGQRYAVQPGEALPLELDDPWSSTTSGSCGATVVQVEGMEPLRVFWPGGHSASSERFASVASPAFRDQSLRLEGTKTLRKLAIGRGLEVTAYPGVVESPTEPPRPFGWSGRVGEGTVTIRRVDVLPDGCLAIEHALGSAVASLYLCVPPSAFPFGPGDVIALSATEQPRSSVAASSGEPPARRLLARATTANDLRAFELWLGAAPGQASIGRLDPVGEPYVTRCGAYVVPLAVRPAGFGLSFAPGESFEITTGGTVRTTTVGRSERVLVAPTACEPERAFLTDRIDLLSVTLPSEVP